MLLTLIAGGAGIILYVVLWVVMPYREPDQATLEHRGESIDLPDRSVAERERIGRTPLRASGAGSSASRRTLRPPPQRRLSKHGADGGLGRGASADLVVRH